ncbi:MAG: hydrogenase nickel incorporation protein HypB [Bacillota bacterium]|jgi:hydrogenase nickel incorporation protein HypB
MKIEVQEIMDVNNAYAAENRAIFKNNGIYAVNILGSPGAGKTSLLEKVLSYLRNSIKAAVIEGDLATARDAARISACNVPVVQINTNGGCHLDAIMISQVLPGFHLEWIDLMIIENVGNLVCPATFDLGEDIKMLIMSIAEGDDKPAKYPASFLAAQVVVLNKMDLLPFVDADIEEMKKEILKINPKVEIFETCCYQGQVSGIDELSDWLAKQTRAKKQAINK